MISDNETDFDEERYPPAEDRYKQLEDRLSAMEVQRIHGLDFKELGIGVGSGHPAEVQSSSFC